MGAYTFGGRVVLGGGAQTLKALLETLPLVLPKINAVRGFATVSMRADPTNAGPVYWSDDPAVTTSNELRCGYLIANGTVGEAYNVSVRSHVGLEGIVLVGTPEDAVFLFLTEA
jgi:hypothetical protein